MLSTKQKTLMVIQLIGLLPSHMAECEAAITLMQQLAMITKTDG